MTHNFFYDLGRDIQIDIKKIDTSVLRLADFGRIFGFIFVVLAFWFGRDGVSTSLWILFVLGIILFIVGSTQPERLQSIYLPIMVLTVILGFFLSRLLLSVVFFVLFLPIGLCLRLMKKDPLNRILDKTASTYWVVRTTSASDVERLS